MSEQKQPMAGEWWRKMSSGRIVFIIGKDADGYIIAHDIDYDTQFANAQNCEHLPNCTGFDWAEPKPEEPADDWVILDPVIYADHVPRDGVDEFYDCKQWRDHTQRHVRSTVGEFAAVSISSRVRCRRSHLPALPVTPATRTIKLCSVVYWDRPEAPMSTILTEQELERHRKAWRVMHVVSETTVEVPL